MLSTGSYSASFAWSVILLVVPLSVIPFIQGGRLDLEEATPLISSFMYYDLRSPGFSGRRRWTKKHHKTGGSTKSFPIFYERQRLDTWLSSPEI
jgi:hypothetical protein